MPSDEEELSDYPLLFGLLLLVGIVLVLSCWFEYRRKKQDPEIRKLSNWNIVGVGATSLASAALRYWKRSNSKKAQSQLTRKLKKYYTEIVDIAPKELDTAKDLVEGVLDIVIPQLSKVYKIEDLEYTGSIYEDLKVIKPNEFDIFIPLGLERDLWSLVEGYDNTENNIPEDNQIDGTRPRSQGSTSSSFENVSSKLAGYWLVKRTNPVCISAWDNLCDVHGYLSPQKIKVAFHKELQHCLNKEAFTAILGPYGYKYKLGGRGVTLKLYLISPKNEIISIEFIVAVHLKDIWVIAKEHPDHTNVKYRLRQSRASYADLWRRSYALVEKDLILQLDNDIDICECKRKCLKIIKVVRLKNPVLADLNSYILKTTLFHINEEGYQWDLNCLGERFKDILRFLEDRLSEGILHHFYDERVNLLQHFKTDQLQTMAQFLNGIRKSNSYEKLLIKIKKK